LHSFAFFSSLFHRDRGGLFQRHVIMGACERVQHVVQKAKSRKVRAGLAKGQRSEVRGRWAVISGQ
jgi:hypothetical protein